jgi:hypothetical protein
VEVGGGGNNLKTKKQMEHEKNCAFQYAKMREGIFRDTQIVEDKSKLTLDEAQQLWNTHFADAAKWIKEGNTVEMVIWINMETIQSYGEHLQYISTDAESDGVSIWETKKSYFKQYADVITSPSEPTQ